jgi:hypothetical protein
MEEHFLVGRIAGLQAFSVPQFGTRASFRLEWPRQDSVTCRVAGDVARELVASYFEGDVIAVKGTYEPRPSTASPKTPWIPRFCIQALCGPEAIGVAA